MSAENSLPTTSGTTHDATAAVSLWQLMSMKSNQGRGVARFSIQQTSQPSADLVTHGSQPTPPKPQKKDGSEHHGTTNEYLRWLADQAVRPVRSEHNRVDERTGTVRVPGVRFGVGRSRTDEQVSRCTGCGSWVYKAEPCRTCWIIRDGEL